MRTWRADREYLYQNNRHMSLPKKMYERELVSGPFNELYNNFNLYMSLY